MRPFNNNGWLVISLDFNERANFMDVYLLFDYFLELLAPFFFFNLNPIKLEARGCFLYLKIFLKCIQSTLVAFLVPPPNDIFLANLIPNHFLMPSWFVSILSLLIYLSYKLNRLVSELIYKNIARFDSSYNESIVIPQYCCMCQSNNFFCIWNFPWVESICLFIPCYGLTLIVLIFTKYLDSCELLDQDNKVFILNYS